MDCVVTNRACRPDIFWRREGDRPVMSRAVVSFWAPEYAASAARYAIHLGTKMPSPSPYETPRSSDFGPHFSPHFPVDFPADFPPISRVFAIRESCHRQKRCAAAGPWGGPPSGYCRTHCVVSNHEGSHVEMAARAWPLPSRCHHVAITVRSQRRHVADMSRGVRSFGGGGCYG
jgi:hypothetical protein